MMEDNVIVVKHPFLKKVVGWLEKRSKLMRSFILTVASFIVAALSILLAVGIVYQFGWVPVGILALFMLVWVKTYMEMD